MKVGEIISVVQDDKGDFPGITVQSISEINEETTTLNVKLYQNGDSDYQEGVKIKEEFSFKQSAKDLLITSQLRTALVINKKIKSSNYQIDTYKRKIYLYGISMSEEEKDLVLDEAKQILDVDDVVASILLVEDLRIQKN